MSTLSNTFTSTRCLGGGVSGGDLRPRGGFACQLYAGRKSVAVQVSMKPPKKHAKGKQGGQEHEGVADPEVVSEIVETNPQQMFPEALRRNLQQEDDSREGGDSIDQLQFWAECIHGQGASVHVTHNHKQAGQEGVANKE